MSTVPQKPKPSGAAYIVPVVIWILFSVLAVFLVVRGVQRSTDIVDNFARIDPGVETTVELSSGGGYRVWLERPGIDQTIGDPSASVTVTRDGDPIAVERYVGDLDYSISGRDATAIYTFNAPEAGEYVITGDVNDVGGGRFAVGKGNPIGEAGKGVLFMILVGTAGFIIALIITIILAVKRGRSKRQIRQATVGAYGAPGYGPPGGYPQPGYTGQPDYGAPPPQGAPPQYGQPVFGAPPPRSGEQPPPPPFGGSPPPPPT